jgi:hypothetical protein
MKRMLLSTAVIFAALNGFAQGTVWFENRVGTVFAPVYGPTGLIGLSLGGQFGASTTFAQLLGAPGYNAPESSLVPGLPVTTFRTGTAAGLVAPVTATFGNIPPDAPTATIQMVAWDNSSGLYPTWAEASVGWINGWLPAGKSAPLNISGIGGLSPAPYLTGLQSFMLSPEPSTFGLLALGAAVVMIAGRRR